ncbi:nitroreductase family protein [Litorivicinus lipolyticus]|uniref:Nitroreductase family protein n=1 Tax=Litorivicinus lipolyticus TaxID=418701 RepID=A0A5Q2QDS7_9GAMM|nr:nitroreductase family protein [Litorivicinus lipolyticus]
MLDFTVKTPAQGRTDVRELADYLVRRRTVRDFSTAAVDPAILADALRAAASAPSGANKQPWHFVVVQTPALKRQIRLAAEDEERAFYAGKAGDQWLDDLKPLATDADKPFLETAPALIAVFLERYGVDADGEKTKNYYMPESVGIACGFLIAALHQAGLATLTHTPSPMGFLNQILDRPKRERPYLLLVVGYPAVGAQVPDIQRKPLDETVSWR